MSACERCWRLSRLIGRDYYEQMRRAEQTHAICTRPTLEGARARAGEFWDDATQSDTRVKEMTK